MEARKTFTLGSFEVLWLGRPLRLGSWRSNLGPITGSMYRWMFDIGPVRINRKRAG